MHTHTHTHTGILFSLKKEVLTFVTWMEVEGIVLNEIQKTEQDKYLILYDITYMWNLQKSYSQKQKVEWYDRLTDKEDVVHVYNGILLSHKKE